MSILSTIGDESQLKIQSCYHRPLPDAVPTRGAYCYSWDQRYLVSIFRTSSRRVWELQGHHSFLWLFLAGYCRNELLAAGLFSGFCELISPGIVSSDLLDIFEEHRGYGALHSKQDQTVDDGLPVGQGRLRHLDIHRHFFSYRLPVHFPGHPKQICDVYPPRARPFSTRQRSLAQRAAVLFVRCPPLSAFT